MVVYLEFAVDAKQDLTASAFVRPLQGIKA